ncbi:DegV family protein [[Eubacterium] hominis]|uniref:DegV family protein n=1 Tax=[Eubacterium] hominis TaxID=2764325 RepID=UPI003A4D9C38
MNKQKTAILTDTCCNVPESFVKQYDMYVIPLKVIYKDAEYLDGIDITPEEVYESMSREIPKSSLPDGEAILAVFDKIKEDGYENVITITLSSGLSGTNNMIHLLSRDYEGLNFFILDTKNISIGGGFHAIQAGRYLEAGMTFDAVCEKLQKEIFNCKVFFVVETLEYLQKGGRIGLVASLFGNALNLKPIISCNEEGIYYTVAKVRGRKQSISKTIELALKTAGNHARYNIAIMNGAAKDLAKEIKEEILPQLPNVDIFLEDQVTPVLGVHTGPGTIGIGVQILED